MIHLLRLLYTLFCIATALIGFRLHHSVFFALVDFFFTPLVWIKWLAYHEVTLRFAADTFRWFFA